MSRLAFAPLAFAFPLALFRAFFGVLPFLAAMGVVSLRGANDRAYDPVRGTGDLTWAALAGSGLWNIGMSMAALLIVAALLVHRPNARRAAWIWVSISTVETVFRVFAAAVSPWLGEQFAASLSGVTWADDACCCIPVNALWTLSFAGWLVATRDPVTAVATPPNYRRMADALVTEGEYLVHTLRPLPPEEPRPNYNLLDDAATEFVNTHQAPGAHA